MIRSVAPGDLWKLRRKPNHQIMLYTEGLLVQTHRPAWFALRCLLRGNGREMTTAIYHDWDGRAVIQSQGRPGRPEQDVVYLAADGTPGAHVPRDYELWYQLLHYICYRAGASYVQRLYAAVPSEHNELREIFRQTGFHTPSPIRRSCTFQAPIGISVRLWLRCVVSCAMITGQSRSSMGQ